MTNVRNKGCKAELKFISEINDLGLGYNVASSRLLSRYMDNHGVDVVDKPDSLKKFPFHVQCKSYTSVLKSDTLSKYKTIFEDFRLTDKPLVIFHELTEKRGSRFYRLGDYVIMKKSDFYEILKKYD